MKERPSKNIEISTQSDIERTVSKPVIKVCVSTTVLLIIISPYTNPELMPFSLGEQLTDNSFRYLEILHASLCAMVVAYIANNIERIAKVIKSDPLSKQT